MPSYMSVYIGTTCI